MEKILVGAPVHVGKEYCFAQYLDLLAALTWQNKTVFLVDTSPTLAFYERWRKECTRRLIRFVHQPPAPTPQETVAQAYNLLRQEALAGDYAALAIIEQDNVPPVNFLERFTALAAAYGAPIVLATYWATYTDRQQEKKPRLLLSGLTEADSLQDRVLEPLESFGILDGTAKPVYGGSFGTCLITSPVLQQILFKGDQVYPDSFFFGSARECNFQVLLDSSMVVPHVNEEYLYRHQS